WGHTTERSRNLGSHRRPGRRTAGTCDLLRAGLVKDADGAGSDEDWRAAATRPGLAHRSFEAAAVSESHGVASRSGPARRRGLASPRLGHAAAAQQGGSGSDEYRPHVGAIP